MAVWTRREWFYKTGLGAAAFTLAPSLLAEEPHITISPLNKLSDNDEIELGRRFAAELEKEETVVSNVLIDHYLGNIVVGLAAQSQRPNLPYQVKLINSHVPNALSLPGGILYVNRGLIGVSSQGHINQSVRVRPRLTDSSLVAWEASWSESEMMKPSDNMLRKEYAQLTRL